MSERIIVTYDRSGHCKRKPSICDHYRKRNSHADQPSRSADGSRAKFNVLSRRQNHDLPWQAAHPFLELLMPRIALSGIPTYFQRSIVGYHDHIPIYRDSLPKVETLGDLREELSHISNTGNYLISEGVRRALEGADTTYLSFSLLSGNDGAAAIDHVNSSFDFLVFATANIFNETFQPTIEASVLAQINIPIVLMSAGIQQRAAFGNAYPEAFGPLMEVLKNKQVFAFTRGHYTADFLKRHGVKWVEPVGCPSIYAYPDNVSRSLRKLSDLELDADLCVVHSGYLGSVTDTTVDFRAFGGNAPADYVVQDEFALFDFEFSAEAGDKVYDEASGLIRCPVNYLGAAEVTRDVSYRVFFSPERWRAWISQSDFSFGRRFHSMVMAAQAGIPALMLSVDDRTKEMLEFAAFPHLDAIMWNEDFTKRETLQSFLAGLDMSWHIERYSVCESKFRTLLKEVGLV